MKQGADWKRLDVEFQVGDMVFLKLQPCRQYTAFKHAYHKLASRFFGPYPILQWIGQVAYKLELPKGACIHPVFHVSLLKNYVGDNKEVSLELPLVADDKAVLLEPTRILDTRWVKQGKRFIMEHLVQWHCLPAKKATWKNAQMLQQQFPTVDLEDKNPLDGERIDRPLRRSTRRGKKNPKYCGEEWLVIELLHAVACMHQPMGDVDYKRPSF